MQSGQRFSIAPLPVSRDVNIVAKSLYLYQKLCGMQARKVDEKKRAAGVELSEPSSSTASGQFKPSLLCAFVTQKQSTVEHWLLETSSANVRSNIASSQSKQAFSADTILDSVNSIGFYQHNSSAGWIDEILL